MRDGASITTEFEKLYIACKFQLTAIAVSFVQDVELAEDIVTDSFVSYWSKREELDPETDVKRYIYGIVKRKCLKHLRDTQNRLRIQKKIFDADFRILQYQINNLEFSKPENMLVDEVLEIARGLLEQMPPLRKAIFLSSRYDEMSYKEIAELYDVPVRKVHYEMQHALALLRVSLKDYLPMTTIIILMDSWKH